MIHLDVNHKWAAAVFRSVIVPFRCMGAASSAEEKHAVEKHAVEKHGGGGGGASHEDRSTERGGPPKRLLKFIAG